MCVVHVTMMEHIYKVVWPLNFMAWANAAHQYHQDNMAVNNIKSIYEDQPKKKSTTQKTGFSMKEIAKVLGVKMPSPGPDQMDTRANHTRSKWCGNQKTHGWVTTTGDPETQHQQGCCFTCNQQGHIAKNCPNKPKQKPKTPVSTCMLLHGQQNHSSWLWSNRQFHTSQICRKNGIETS